MLTVGSSSATPASAERETAEATAKDSSKRVPLIAIPITLAVGLLVASGYVGNRILSSRKHATAVVVASVPSSSPAAVPAAAPAHAEAETPRPSEAPRQSTAPQRAASAPASEAASAGPAKAAGGETTSAKGAQNDGAERDNALTQEAESGSESLIAPRHGDRYLQIAAISASAAQKFLAGLGHYNLRASVAPGPHDGLVRVVIGPFPDRESVAAAKAQIESKWPDCFVRLY